MSASLTHIFFLMQCTSIFPNARLVLIPSTVPHKASILDAKQDMAMEPNVKTLHFEHALPIPCTSSRDIKMRNGCYLVSR